MFEDYLSFKLNDKYLSTEKIFGKLPIIDNEEWDQVSAYMTNYYREYLYKEYPRIKIDYNKLIPTQRGVDESHVKNIIDNHSNNEDTGAIVVKWNNNFYIWEGHHRICAKILKGDKKILVHLIDYDQDLINYKNERNFSYKDDDDEQWK
jgi:hypothetical protein